MSRPISVAKDKDDEKALRSPAHDARVVPGDYFPFFYNADGTPVWINGTFFGQSAFVLASGPSALSLDLGRLDTLWTLTLNNAHVTYRGNASCVVDDPSRFGLSLWLDPSVLKFVPMSHFGRPLWDNRRESR